MNGSCASLRLLAALLSLALIATCESVDYRLGRNISPSYYNLTIKLRGDAANPATTFEGDVSITLRALQANVNQIRLHADTLDINGCWLYSGPGQLVEHVDVARLTFEPVTQQLTVPLAQSLAVQEDYRLHFQFTGKVRTDMAGLFSASYVEEETGKTRWMAVTQMQRLNARLVFPCFDEPNLKAKFELHIGRQSGFNAISNTKLTHTTAEGSDRFMDHFEVTPVMSTYLLAFVVSEYQARGNINKTAVVTRPEYYNYTEFSYNVAERVLPAYDLLFGMPYEELGNELLLHASSPRFPHNGMENWGLIIYSDAVLVQQPGYSDGWKDKEFTIRIIAHETSHMWFGDSVTFVWWSYFWLNEAFARYFEYFMAHELYPEFQLDEQFVVRQLQLIFNTDAVASTQPMTSPEMSIQTPSDIGNKFSSIAYAKGASIVRMWQNAMGRENFFKAIGTYLKQHHLGNTEPKDLFAHLKQNWPTQQRVDLDQFFYDFTEQVGYPAVTVNISGEKQLVTLRQQRFLLNPGDGSDANIRYTVPITYATNLSANFQNLTPSIYFNKTEDHVELSFDTPIDWIVINLKQSNYHRVFYDTPLLRQIQRALAQSRHSGIVVENRAQLVDDLFSFARVGQLDYAEVFEFLEYMSWEIDYIPWYAAYEGMQRVAQRLSPQQLPNFEKYLSDITAAVYAKLGVSWSDDADSVLDVYNRIKQVAWLCKHRHAACNKQVQERFEEGGERPSPDYRETFYCAAARTDGYERVLDLYRRESRSSERELLWRAASCTRDYRSHYQVEILGDDSSVPLKTIGLAQLYQQNPDLVTPIFAMLTENITQLAEALDSWPQTAQALSNLADYLTTREQQQQFSEFYDESHELFGSSAETLRKALATVEENVQWAERRLGRLASYLSQRNVAAGLNVMATTLLLLLMMMSSLLGL